MAFGIEQAAQKKPAELRVQNRKRITPLLGEIRTKARLLEDWTWEPTMLARETLRSLWLQSAAADCMNEKAATDECDGPSAPGIAASSVQCGAPPTTAPCGHIRER
jgi:hypothetical protein